MQVCETMTVPPCANVAGNHCVSLYEPDWTSHGDLENRVRRESGLVLVPFHWVDAVLMKRVAGLEEKLDQACRRGGGGLVHRCSGDAPVDPPEQEATTRASSHLADTPAPADTPSSAHASRMHCSWPSTKAEAHNWVSTAEAGAKHMSASSSPSGNRLVHAAIDGGRPSSFHRVRARVLSWMPCLASLGREANSHSRSQGEHLSHWFESKQRRRSRVSRALWNFFEEPESSLPARIYAAVMMPTILASVLLCLLQSTDPPVLYGLTAAITETTLDSMFLLELLFRFIVCPNRLQFVSDWLNINDFLSTIPPLIVRAYINFILDRDRDYQTASWSFLLGAVPMTRLLKLLRRFRKFRLLFRAFRLAFEALPVLLFIYAIIGLFFAALFFFVETRENLPNLPTALWMTVITMTTTGYGDKVALSSAGKIITGVCIITTTLYTAVPLGIIGDTFRDVWINRDRILLAQQTRGRLLENGYTEVDLPKLFDLFDGDGGGSLDWEEFLDMFHEMNIGLTERRIFELFRLFDPEAEGSIDKRKFVFTIFPEAKLHVYETRHSLKINEIGEIPAECEEPSVDEVST